MARVAVAGMRTIGKALRQNGRRRSAEIAGKPPSETPPKVVLPCQATGCAEFGPRYRAGDAFAGGGSSFADENAEYRAWWMDDPLLLRQCGRLQLPAGRCERHLPPGRARRGRTRGGC